MAGCPHETKWLNGCKFEPRFENVPPTALQTIKLDTTVAGMEAYIRAMTKRAYVWDICVRCGRTIQPLKNAKTTEDRG
jgi:hypothetical protein